MGKFAEAEKDIQAALHLDPKNLNILQTVTNLPFDMANGCFISNSFLSSSKLRVRDLFILKRN